MKYLHLAVTALFLLCAYWQLNDPDWNQWVAAYGIVAFISVRAFFGGLRPIVAALPAIALFAWWCSYIPEFAQWLSDGMPTITGSMKAESPHVELTREFFGLLICWGTLAYYVWWSWRQERLAE
ncbi:transmembrane 220 family protein [Neolewinella agarilytica]|uniref:Transmembrane family 220, helix n=1 Tax=Neolewinella agarilytica TaxID=478744 RepID=A0A1H9I3H5_9BACT|nr:transmembrane 220 family protein [Neolewinella agarilytica]SEQ69231.1 Transmembrane family 220, helix [Neolewinella agarilytica]